MTPSVGSIDHQLNTEHLPQALEQTSPAGAFSLEYSASNQASAERSAPKSMDENVPTILIAGDWIVDEYRFLLQHHSDVASHIGFAHYRLSSDPGHLVSDLCGAGLVARLLFKLYQDLRRGGGHRCRLVGLGLWNDRDTCFIAHLIHSHIVGTDCTAAKIQMSITPDVCGTPPPQEEVELWTMRKDHATIRVVRSYHERPGGLQQLDRVDFEPESKIELTSKELEDLAHKLPPTVSAIVFYDRGKGAKETGIIPVLAGMYPRASWYVKGKEAWPNWLKHVKKENFKLLVIGPEVATKLNPWNRWLPKTKEVNLPALQLLEDLRPETTVLLSDNREVIARVKLPDHSAVDHQGKECPERCEKECKLDCKQVCYKGKSGAPATALTQLGWSSAFFAALVYKMIERPKAPQTGTKPEEIEKEIEQAMLIADQHASAPVPRRPAQEEIALTPELPKLNVEKGNWKEDRRKWKEAIETELDGAIESIGVIQDDGKARLQVWRGSTQIPGYVACIKRKKDIIDEIGHKLIGFHRAGSENPRSLSILLQADPGSGKTFLAKSLAQALKFSFLGFDISQMAHREELLDLFDMVATRQAELKATKPLLVFVDEINSKLDAANVYGAFLSPIEEGVYLRRGNAFRLQPCVWIFAATKSDDGGTARTGREGDITLRSEKERSTTARSEKEGDITSRMTMVRNIGFASLREDTTKGLKENDSEYVRRMGIFIHQARLEQVYLAATIMRGLYSDIRMVSYEVLHYFYRLEPDKTSARSIRNLIGDLSNVQYGQVTRKNLPAYAQKELEDYDHAAHKDLSESEQKKLELLDQTKVELEFE